MFIKTTSQLFVDFWRRTYAYYYNLNQKLFEFFIKAAKQQTLQSVTTNIKILQDNASQHLHKNYLEIKDIIFKLTSLKVYINHIPYSPDLDHSEFWFRIKKILINQIYLASLKKYIAKILETLSREEYLLVFEKY